MNTDTANNPPAFPNINGDFEARQRGMTLRDYFAAEAMPEVIRELWGEEDAANQIAECCYQLADAMLRERQKEPKQ
jgi:hypothetical protein